MPGSRPYMPVDDGRRPVSRLDRDGLQSGAWQWALENSVPRRARASMLGVFAWAWPPRQPIQSFWSSMAMKRMLGFRDEPEASAPGVWIGTANRMTTATT